MKTTTHIMCVYLFVLDNQPSETHFNTNTQRHFLHSLRFLVQFQYPSMKFEIAMTCFSKCQGFSFVLWIYVDLNVFLIQITQNYSKWRGRVFVIFEYCLLMRYMDDVLVMSVSASNSQTFTNSIYFLRWTAVILMQCLPHYF